MGEYSTIPKIIHYCWFGGREKPEIVKKCIESWKKYLPDYELKEWNESNTLDIENNYFRTALKNAKWAFAADYARFYVLYNQGGIYLDTDEELFSDLDAFLKYDLFLGFERYESRVSPMGGVIGAKKNNADIAAFLKSYDLLKFEIEKNCFDMTPITHRLRSFFIQQYDLPSDIDGKSVFNFGENSAIFPANYFCEYSEIEPIAMHHYAFSWKNDVLSYKYRIFTDPVSETHNYSIYYVPKTEVPKNINAKVLFRCPFFEQVILLVKEPRLKK